MRSLSSPAAAEHTCARPLGRSTGCRESKTRRVATQIRWAGNELESPLETFTCGCLYSGIPKTGSFPTPRTKVIPYRPSKALLRTQISESKSTRSSLPRSSPAPADAAAEGSGAHLEPWAHRLTAKPNLKLSASQGMTPIHHDLWLPLRESLSSLP